jgi:hypothetical protein
MEEEIKLNDEKKEEIRKESKQKPEDKKRGFKGKRKFDRKPKFNNNAGEWYWSSELQGNLVTNIPYDHVAGSSFGIKADADIQVFRPDTVLNDFDGNIMVAQLNMDIGEVNDVDAPINQAIINAYNKVRGTRTASVPFKSGDFGPYLYAIGSIFALVGHMKRALNMVHYYNINNNMMPIPLFRAIFGRALTDEAAKEAYDDIVDNYPKYVWQLNNQIERLVRISVPGNYSFFKKCEWIFNHTWYDDESGQHGNIYAYVPGDLYRFNSKKPLFDDATVTATGCDIIGSDESNWSENYDKLKRMISALVEDDNAIQMSVWIDQNYEGATNAQVLANTDTCSPEFTQDVNKQFKNIIIRGGTTHTIQQNSAGYLENDDYLAGSEADTDERVLASLNSYIYDTGSADIGKDFLVGSRMMQVLVDDHGKYRSYCDNFSCTGIEIYTNIRHTNSTGHSLDEVDIYSNVLVADNPIDTINQMAALSQFKCKPTFYVVSYQHDTNPSDDYDKILIYHEFERPTSISKEDLLNMLTYSVKAQFGLPNITRKN